MQFSSRHSLQSATFSQDLINLWPRPKISLFSLSSPPHLSFPFFPFPSERKLPPGGERDKQNDADYSLHVGGLALSERTRCMRVCDKSTVSDGQVAEWLCLARLAKAVMMYGRPGRASRGAGCCRQIGIFRGTHKLVNNVFVICSFDFYNCLTLGLLLFF